MMTMTMLRALDEDRRMREYWLGIGNWFDRVNDAYPHDLLFCGTHTELVDALIWCHSMCGPVDAYEQDTMGPFPLRAWSYHEREFRFRDEDMASLFAIAFPVLDRMPIA